MYMQPERKGCKVCKAKQHPKLDVHVKKIQVSNLKTLQVTMKMCLWYRSCKSCQALKAVTECLVRFTSSSLV